MNARMFVQCVLCNNEISVLNYALFTEEKYTQKLVFGGVFPLFFEGYIYCQLLNFTECNHVL